MAVAGTGTSCWVAPNFAIQAASSGGYTMFCWVRTLPGSQSTAISWASAVELHSTIYSFSASGYPDGYGWDDIDNAGNDDGVVVFQPHGGWVPVLVSKSGQAAAQSTIYATSTANYGIGGGPGLGAQTLNNLYLASYETQAKGILQPGEALAEVAIWAGPLGPSETAQLLSGACPLTVAPGRLRCYFPLADDLRDYGPSSIRLTGPAPSFTDHPPVQNFRNVLNALQDSDSVFLTLTPVTGTLSATAAPATIVSAAGPIVGGKLAATTGAATLAGVASNGSITGRLVATTANATLVGSGGTATVGTLSATTAAATLVGVGVVGTPIATTPTSVISIGAIGEQSAEAKFLVQGTYSLYPTLVYSDDASAVQTQIPLADATPYGLATFEFTHPGETPGQHTLTITDTTFADSASTSYVVDQFGNVIATFPPTGPALTSIIPAYVYEQYYDDANIQSFIGAYNSMATTYLTWFNNINLPIYTGSQISGSLLDWVAQGLYGIARPTLALVKPSTSLGPFNTYTLDSILFNAGIANSTAIVLTATDDIFKRIITWSLYKADGKIFSVKWLKRRIMRFLAGVNGTDYTGPTYQASVKFSAGNVINITLTSGPVELTAAAIFQVALLSGVLPIPFKYTPTVTIPNG